MKTTCIILLAASAAPSHAQVEYHLNFDTADPPSIITIDSIYPGAGWQIGYPQKTVFDQPLSFPNALVTDTVEPYQAPGQWYSEFHIPAQYTAPVYLDFQQWMDIDPNEAYGSLEYYDGDSGLWIPARHGQPWATGYVEYDGTAATVTDSGVFYVEPSSGWTLEHYRFTCQAVLMGEERGGGMDTTMRFRFRFTSTANTNARDGWAIDNVHLSNWDPCTSIEELEPPLFQVWPNPVDRELVFVTEEVSGRQLRVDLVSATGKLVMRDWVSPGSRVIDVGGVGEGPYVLRATSDRGHSCARVIVQH